MAKNNDPTNWTNRGQLVESARSEALRYIYANGNIAGCELFSMDEEMRVHSYLTMTGSIQMAEERGKYLVTPIGLTQMNRSNQAKAETKPKQKATKDQNEKPETTGFLGSSSESKTGEDAEPLLGEIMPHRKDGKFDTRNLAVSTASVMEGLLKGEIPVAAATQYCKLLDGIINLKKTELAIGIAKKSGVTVSKVQLGE